MYRTVTEIRQAHAGHFFDRDTMRFWQSRVLSGVIGGHYFITSEPYPWEGPRRYFVRDVDHDGTIATVGSDSGYASAESARRAARLLAGE
jgi:hypothetical protein